MCARCERRCAREDCKSNEPAHFRPARRRFLAAVFPPPQKKQFSPALNRRALPSYPAKLHAWNSPAGFRQGKKKKKKWNNISGAPKAFTLSPSLNHERTICISKISFSSIDCPLSDENASSQREPLFLAVTSSSSSCAFGSSVCLLLGWSRSWSHKNFCIRKKEKISSVSRRDLQSLSSSCGKCSATSTRINHRSPME